jgi:hypothetical protein
MVTVSPGLEAALGSAGGKNDFLSDDVSPYGQLVAASALVIQTGGDAPDLGKYIGQMSGVCQTLGWPASS